MSTGAPVGERATVGRGRLRASGQGAGAASMVLALGFLVVLAVIYSALFAGREGHFPGTYEWASVVDAALPLVFAGLAQAVVVLTGGLDLSIGGMMDITNAVVAIEMRPSAGSMLLWSLVALAIGAAGGLMNGLLVSRGRMPPILVTLASLSIFQGIAVRVLSQPGGTVPGAYTNVLTDPSAPWGLIWIAVAVAAWLIFRRTRLGVNVLAVGNDPLASRSRGVNVDSAILRTYMLSGCLAATAGMFLAATSTSGDPTSGDAFTLTSIAAVVVGGLSLAGGRGSPIGVVAAALALTVLVNVLFFANVSPLYVDLYEGLFLIAAVLLASVLGRIWKGRDVGHQ